MANDRRSTFRCVRLAAAALAFGIFSTAGIAGVGAQDASPEATPAVVCNSPGLPPGTPTPMDMGSPEAAGEMSDIEAASPEAVQEATSSEADDPTAAAILGAVENYFACYNEGQATGDPGLYVALESDAFVASQGYASRYDEVADEMGSPFPTVELLGAGTALTWSDGRVSADVQALVGPHWYNEWRWFMVEVDGVWMLDERVDLPPRPDVDFVTVNGINLTEATDDAGNITYAFESRSGSWEFTQTQAMVFNFTNTGVEPHEALLVQLPEGADPMGILDGSVSFEDVTFFGGVFDIMPEESVDLTMIDLAPGTYTLLCFFPSPDGQPHAAHGMVQQFEIVAAEG